MQLKILMDLLTPKKKTPKRTVIDTRYGEVVEVWEEESDEDKNEEDTGTMVRGAEKRKREGRRRKKRKTKTKTGKERKRDKKVIGGRLITWMIIEVGYQQETKMTQVRGPNKHQWKYSPGQLEHGGETV